MDRERKEGRRGYKHIPLRLLRIKETNSEDFKKAWDIYTHSFPEDEKGKEKI